MVAVSISISFLVLSEDFVEDGVVTSGVEPNVARGESVCMLPEHYLDSNRDLHEECNDKNDGSDLTDLEGIVS